LRYPGSPRLVRALLREGDRMVLVELNRDDCRALAACFAHDRMVKVACGDGYAALKAHLPPRERRALVLMDAAFDASGEFDRLVAALADAHRRFATGVYALWYPLMTPVAMAAFERDVVGTGLRRLLLAELSVRQPHSTPQPLRGAGLLVVNPPFGFEGEARAILDWLAPVLAVDPPGHARVAWLVPE
jgi:23S rRNA (adenine2030-N6)-methyltransferase